MAAGGIGPFQGAGAPVLGVNEIQTVTFGGTGAGATFRIRFRNELSGVITWSSTSATLIANILAALQAMATIGTGGVTVVQGTMAAGLGTALVTFLGVNANLDVPLMTVEQVTGALTVTVAETTKGVMGTARGASTGAFYVDTLAGDLYVNDGSNHAPQWAMVGIRKAKVALGASDAAGGILAWQNPEPVNIFVIRLVVKTTVKATGACVADFGKAANGTTLSDTLIDGADLGTAITTVDNYLNHGTNGLSMVELAPGEYITGSKETGSAVGLVGAAHILYIRS